MAPPQDGKFFDRPGERAGGDSKLSDLALAAAPTDADLFYTVQGGTSFKQTMLALKAYTGAGSGAPPFPGTSKAGLPVHSDVPVGYWMLIKDTVNNTTGLYYNDAGVLQVAFLSAAPLPPYNPTYYVYGF